MPQITLRAAHIGDIETIQQLAHVIWYQHYPSVITTPQIEYMLGLMYSKESLARQLTEKGHRFFLIHVEGNDVGFISVNPEKADEWFINKFYINQSIASKGIGSEAFQELQKIIKAKKITLTVNRQNFKSVNFYFKLGFKIERVADFDIGNGYVMNDFVMVWNT